MILHKLSTPNSHALNPERQAEYQEQLYKADKDTIELARMLQEAAGVMIDGIAPLYINQATAITESPLVHGMFIGQLSKIAQARYYQN